MDEQRRWSLAVSALGLGTLLNPLNSSMLAVGLVALRQELGVSVTEVTWIVSVFYLTSAIAQPLMGRVADLAGPRRVFVCGMALVSVASLVAPLTGSFVFLCAMRVIISVGTAAAYPAALAVIRARAETTGFSALRAIARVQFGNSIGVVLGPVVGGLIVSVLPWQVLFWLSAPLALVSLVLVSSLVRADRPDHVGRSLVRELDLPGVVLFAAVIVPALVCLSGLGWGLTTLLITLSVVAAIALVRHGRTAKDPFIDFELIASAVMLPIYFGFWLMTTVYYCVFYGLPQYLEEALGFDPGHVGVLMMPLAGAALLANPFVARALARFPTRRVLLVGAIVMLFSSAALLLLSESASPILVLGVCAVVGVPYCISTLGFATAMYDVAPANKVGVATGLLQTCRHLGGAVAMALLGLLFSAGIDAASMARLVLVMVLSCLTAAAVTATWRVDRSDPFEDE